MNDLLKRFVAGVIVEPPVELVDKDLDQNDNLFAVHCPQTLLDKMIQHAITFKHTEIFGLLLGRVAKGPGDKVRTIVQDFIPAQHFRRSTLTFVEVSAEELMRMDRAYEASNQKDLLKVGWFHSHPGHGIFMSRIDKENHSLYRKQWQVALVIDPVHRSFGFFHGNECDHLTTIVTPETLKNGQPISNAGP